MKVDGIYRTMAVSFPRSGHHWLQRMLQEYFGDRLHYCESYVNPELKMGECKATNYQKSHDFSLDDPIEKYQYLVQVREPEAALQSWYKLGWEDGSVLGSYEAFHRCKSAYWVAFLNKWTREDWKSKSRRLVLYYSDLRRDPINKMALVIGFLTRNEEDVDWDLVGKVVSDQWKYD